MTSEESLPAGWFPLDDRLAAVAAQWLESEVTLGHSLFAKKVFGLARREDRDDYLFRLADGGVAEVHLTFSPAQSPPWPIAQNFTSFQAWAAQCRPED
jgi:hypothetical protein